jgi:hypothetical protein
MNRNIYEVLDKINFEEHCKRSSELLKVDEWLLQQIFFSVVQKFYEELAYGKET